MAFVASKCTQCGADIQIDDSKESGFCSNCGTKFVTEKLVTQKITNVEQQVNYYVNTDEKGHASDDAVKCPQCGSTNVHFITKSGKSFDGKDACCGYLMCGPIGLLFGAKNKPDTTTRKCMKCGKEF